MIFDSWGGVLADGAFQEFSLAYTTRVLAQLKKEHDGVRIPSHRLHQRRRAVARRNGAYRTATCWGVDWTVNSGQSARTGG
jgi:uroporphyrinogen decarboxylase